MEKPKKSKLNEWISEHPKKAMIAMFGILLVSILIHIWTGYIKEPEPMTEEASIQLAIDTLLVEKKESSNFFEILDKYESYQDLKELEKEYKDMIDSESIDTVKIREILRKLKQQK